MTPSDCIWLMVAMTSRMFTQALYQAASTELSSSRLCGNTTANRIPKRLEDKAKTVVIGAETAPIHETKYCRRRRQESHYFGAKNKSETPDAVSYTQLGR